MDVLTVVVLGWNGGGSQLEDDFFAVEIRVYGCESKGVLGDGWRFGDVKSKVMIGGYEGERFVVFGGEDGKEEE